MIALLWINAVGFAQTIPPPSTQIYANFFGTWAGSNHYQKEGVWLDDDVELNIFPDKRGMRFDYAYGTKGQKGYEHYTRYLTLLPEKSEVIFQWKGQSRDTYPASGLTTFSQTGFGTFVFTRNSLENGIPTQRQCSYNLGKDSLTYQWAASEDGSPFKLTAIWKLRRRSSGVNSTSP